MGNFIKQIKSQGTTFDFSFLRIYTIDGVKFFVSVIEGAAASYYFTIQKRDCEWKIDKAPKVPDWIMALEPEFAMAIEENEE